jgi:hypothetical protein
MKTSATTSLAVGLVLVLCGCGSSGQDATNTGDQVAAKGGNRSSAGTAASGINPTTALPSSPAPSSSNTWGGTSSLGGTNAQDGSSSTTPSPSLGGQTGGCRTCSTDNCGLIDDGCGMFIDCGECKLGICGAVTPGYCSTCTPIECSDKRANCGALSDGCGKLLDCGICPPGQECGIGGPNICGDPLSPGAVGVAECKNFCAQQAKDCPAGSSTAVKGTVYAPSGYPAIKPDRGEAPLPLPNAVIYVPNASMNYPYGLSVLKDGVSGGACACEVQGEPLVQTTSSTDGTFTLTGVPAGNDIPLVIQLGRWRRLVTIPNVSACSTTELKPEQTRLPRKQAEGSSMDAIPLMALSTGAVDALECVFRKMGVEDSQFSNAGGSGRIHFYRDNGSSCTTGGGSCTGTTPGMHTLTASQATVDKYDAILYACNGDAHDEPAAEKARILDVASNTNAYVNKGGRAYFTHFSYAWLYDVAPSNQLPWPSTTSTMVVNTQWDTANGAIDTSFERGATFAKWLGLPVVNALTSASPVPYISIEECRRDMGNPATWPGGLPAQRWIYSYNNSRYLPSDAIQHVTFDTPWGLPAAQQCGRVLFSSFHVTTAAISAAADPLGSLLGGLLSTSRTTDLTFPNECSTTFTAQEKVLAYMMFDMTSCVQPPPKTCSPKNCSEQNISCGPAGDGCGGEIDCGPCCVPLDCSASGHRSPEPTSLLNCQYPDGCGATLECACDVG